MLFHQDNAPCHKSIASIAKLHELHFKLLPYPSYPPDIAPSDYWLFVDPRRMLQRKKFGSNEEVKRILRPKINRSTKKGIELLEKRWNQCTTQEGDYVDE